MSALGAHHVVDYRDPDWPERVCAITGGRGVAAAVNAVPGCAADALRAVVDGGRLATITSDPPAEERGITVSNVYVRPDGSQLRTLAKHLADGTLAVPVAFTYSLADAAAALARTTSGHTGGAIVLRL